ncbi:uncharacterized protein F4822DRAFT_18660 [Hypoxylon trugodes]|uniref:uncharacterized protein n=1 Tax=Hypoxylon trugodes TaxID=326681 RepID=UPI002197C25C|nr:uncharacterized protein F4822DRAFT_18660 [Hypoxylon trugodes]KAI1393616.1 hypothetical protein F4822DRAFT_18660 [Hypoxylon trugodes]
MPNHNTQEGMNRPNITHLKSILRNRIGDDSSEMVSCTEDRHRCRALTVTFNDAKLASDAETGFHYFPSARSRKEYVADVQTRKAAELLEFFRNLRNSQVRGPADEEDESDRGDSSEDEDTEDEGDDYDDDYKDEDEDEDADEGQDTDDPDTDDDDLEIVFEDDPNPSLGKGLESLIEKIRSNE